LSRSIAFFDFDGTITSHDTMFELIRYAKGESRYLAGMAFLFPVLAAVKAGFYEAQKGKERLLGHFFSGTESQKFRELCEGFTAEKLPNLLRPLALQEIKKHQDKGSEVVVVSASAGQWVSPWTEKMKIRLISSKLSEKENIISGRLDGLNCNGEQKVIRIREVYNLDEYETIFCYGDSKGDLPMLNLATKAFFKPFRH